MAEKRVRVLLVEDTESVRRFLADLLDVDGFEIVGVAGSGAEALDLLHGNLGLDVVVIDFKMPDMDGIETARRARAARPELPIVMYTAYESAELEVAARDVGVDVVVGKVEGIDRLEEQVLGLLKRRPPASRQHTDCLTNETAPDATSTEAAAKASRARF